MPHDSIIKRKNTFVKYVLVDRGFDVSIGCNGWQKTLGYRFNCNVAAVYIPIYDWSSDQIIALQRGCGSGCRMSIYYLVNSDSVYERMNVLAYDEKRNLIAYYEYPDFIIENIVNCRKKNYFIKDTPACAISALCFNQTKFSGSHVNVNMIVQWKGSERTIRKTFQIPYGL